MLCCCFTLTPAHQSARSLFSQPRTPRPLPSDSSSDPSSHAQPPLSDAPDYSIVDDLVEEAEYLVSEQQDTPAGLKRFRLAGLLGHSGALATAGALQLIGDSQIPRNIPAAIHHLNLAASAGQPDAHALLGSLHASGIADRHGIVKSSARAFLYWTVAAESGDAYASTALGFRHLYGIGAKQSCRVAARYYRRAAHSIATDPRYWPSAANFVQGKPPLPTGLIGTPPVRLNDTTFAGKKPAESDQDIVQFYRHSAEHGVATSRTILGALYYFGGHGIEPDENEARTHLEIAADANQGEAHAILGHLDMRDHKNESALKHFIYSAGHQERLGHYALGMVHLHGLLGMERDYAKARMHFEIAHEKKQHSGACFQLGLLYWNGKGGPQNVSEAYKLFEIGAKLGNIQSKLNVGTILVDGSAPVGKSKCKEGVRLLKEVAEEGEWRTHFELAMERVVDGDWYGALHRYLEAAYAGIELGQHNAAFLLESKSLADFPELEHWDRKRMLDEAHQLYEYSSFQGHTDSLIRSANVMYSELKDYEQAARTFQKAAKLKNAEGMVSLGLMHAQGLGVEQNRARAIDYLNTASVSNEEAFAPAKVALLGLYIYWTFEDIWSNICRIGEWAGSVRMEDEEPSSIGEEERAAQQQQQSALHMQQNSTIFNYSGDVAVVGTLLLALLTVLIVRTKRLAARQASTRMGDRESEPDNVDGNE